MYLHGYTNPKDIIFDMAKLFCVGNSTTEDDYPNNWKLVYPNIFANSPFSGESYPDFWETGATESEMDSFALKFFKPTTQDELAEDRSWLYRMLVNDPRIVVKCMGQQLKVWRKKVKLDIGTDPTSAGSDNPNAIQVDLPNGARLAPGGSIRVMIEGKKYSLYRVESIVDVKVIEFYIEGGTSSLILPSSCKDSRILIDFEEDISSANTFHPYYLQLERPLTVKLDQDNAINSKTNYFYLTWRQGDRYDENAHKNPEIGSSTVTTAWSASNSYSVGQRVMVAGEPTRFFQCKTPINRTGGASISTPTAASGNVNAVTLSFSTKLWEDVTGANEADNTYIENALSMASGSTGVISGVVYNSTAKTVQVNFSTPMGAGDKVVYISTGTNKLYDDSNNLIASFNIELTSTLPNVWTITPDPTGASGPAVSASVEQPIQGTNWILYWEEVYIYSAEPAWLEYRMVQETKWSWYKCNAQTVQYVQDWLPIEYWFNIDGSSAVAVIMGDPGMSATDYLSSPAYFGQLEQIEGALETDDKGNFACFSGSDQDPQSRNEKADISGEIPRLKRFGDYTATGSTDVMLTSSKSGRPFQGHKVGLFGMYEFKEQTFNGQSSHTNKHSVTDIVVADVHENERGILKNCLGVPKLGKEHGVELVADRYMANKEKTYIFLHINSLYTPFNTGNDVLIGIAIRTDN